MEFVEEYILSEAAQLVVVDEIPKKWKDSYRTPLRYLLYKHMKKFITEEAVRDLNSWTGSRRSWAGGPLGKNDELGLGEG